MFRYSTKLRNESAYSDEAKHHLQTNGITSPLERSGRGVTTTCLLLGRGPRALSRKSLDEKEKFMRRKALIFTFTLTVEFALTAIVTLDMTGVAIAQGGSIYEATLAEPNQKTQEVSTEVVRRILAEGSAIVLDTRKRSEYVAGHIPGARNVDAQLPVLRGQRDPRVTWARWGLRYHKGRPGRQVRPDPRARRGTRALPALWALRALPASKAPPAPAVPLVRATSLSRM